MSDAYREAYSTGRMKPATVNREAHALMANPKITARVERLQRQKDRAVIAASLSVRKRVLDKLLHLMDHAVPSDSAKLRAAELLGKSIGLFKDVQVQVQEDPRTADELQAELKERLSALLVDPPDIAVH